MNNQKGMMIEGVIWKQLLYFSIPLLLGNLFQQLYNTVDSIVVGNTLGSDALAAVGSSGPIINLLVSVFMGLALGCSVIVSQYFGAQNDEELHKAIHTGFAFILVSGVLLSIIGISFTPQILRWMGTPDAVFNNSILYLKIFFSGIMAMLIYNMGSAILRAVGDSKRPLYYLIVSSLTNIVLDIVFVVYMEMGIAGAAWATVISQAFSAILVMLQLIFCNQNYRVVLSDIRFHKDSFIKMFKIGLPSSLQNGVVSFSNVIVQSNINSFGALAMAGCSAYSKIDGFAILPVLSFSMALTTFVGQNVGANRPERVKEGAKIGVLMSCGITLLISLILLVFAPQLLSIFNDDPSVIYYGSYMMRSVMPFYLFLSLSHSLSGVLRGAGKTAVPMIIMIAFWCVLRMIWISALMPVFNDLYVVFSGYAVTWLSSAIALTIYYRKGKWLNCEV